MTKIDELINWFDGQTKVLVALSGGVDSALVAYAAHKSLGNSAIAVTADYKTLAHEELESSEKICSEIGIRHIVVQYNDLTIPNPYLYCLELLMQTCLLVHHHPMGKLIPVKKKHCL